MKKKYAKLDISCHGLLKQYRIWLVIMCKKGT